MAQVATIKSVQIAEILERDGIVILIILSLTEDTEVPVTLPPLYVKDIKLQEWFDVLVSRVASVVISKFVSLVNFADTIVALVTVSQVIVEAELHPGVDSTPLLHIIATHIL
jgi:hypothetical protein